VIRQVLLMNKFTHETRPYQKSKFPHHDPQLMWFMEQISIL